MNFIPPAPQFIQGTDMANFTDALKDAPHKTTLTNEQLRTATAQIVREEIIAERLNGDARGFNRWVSQNKSYFDYRCGLKKATFDGKAASVQATDAAVAAGRAKQGWRVMSDNTVARGDGVVMTKALARKLGWEG